MELKEQSNFRGDYLIEIVDTKTGEIEVQHLKNTLTNINRDIRLAMLLGDTSGRSFDDINIKYFAFGTGEDVATPEQTQLVRERFRKQITTKEIKNNYVESIVSLSASEANDFGIIREIGVFGGSSASGAPNSGNMISRIVVNIDKFENKIINIIRRDFVNI